MPCVVPRPHNGGMGATEPMPAVRWYRSFYFRIGFVFVVFVVAVVIAQNTLFTVLMSRSAGPAFPGRPPNNVAAILAADVASAHRARRRPSAAFRDTRASR